MARFPVLRRSGRDRGERGAVAVEFALITPLLLLLVFGVIEFGFMLNRDTIVNNASRDGARVASLDGSFADTCTAVKTELSQSGIPVPASCGVTTQPTTILIDCKKLDGSACNASSSTYDDLAESGTTTIVRVIYHHRLITPFISSILGNSVTLQQNTQMRVE